MLRQRPNGSSSVTGNRIYFVDCVFQTPHWQIAYAFHAFNFRYSNRIKTFGIRFSQEHCNNNNNNDHDDDDDDGQKTSIHTYSERHHEL